MTSAAVVVILVGAVVLVALRPSNETSATSPTSSTPTSDLSGGSSGQRPPGPTPTEASLSTERSTSTTTSSTTTTMPVPVRQAEQRSPAGTPVAALDAVDIAQELATAYAHDDWDSARRLNPSKAGTTDGEFASPDRYGDLLESTVILSSASPSGASDRIWSLRVGLVASQTGGRSSIYCVTWTVNLDSGTVSEASSGNEVLADHVVGTLDAETQIDRIQREC